VRRAFSHPAIAEHFILAGFVSPQNGASRFLATLSSQLAISTFT
jgi:hypothetical protein